MKRYSVFIIVILMGLSVGSAFAQSDPKQTVTLNDATPGIDVVISAPGTNGAVALQLSGASVTVTDQAGKIVFQMADPRVHSLELHFAPNAQTHTVTIQRLPGVSEAYVTATSQLGLTPINGTQLITTGPLNIGQELDTRLTANTSGITVPLTIPKTSPDGAVTASFPGAPVTAQIVDSQGVSLAKLTAGQIDGMSMTLKSGDYGLTLLNTEPSINTVAAVSLVPGTEPALQEAVMTQPAPTETQAVISVPSTPDCTIQIAQSSINLRSGPGTGYSILNYGFRGDKLTVGGTNRRSSWLLVANAQGSAAWMDGNLGSLNGSCGKLPVYDIPYREASIPAIIIQPAPASGGGSSPVISGGHERGENGGSEGNEKEGGD
jgi:uncharacterized protein YraI